MFLSRLFKQNVDSKWPPGAAVTFVITIAGVLNWFVHKFITGSKAFNWLSFLGINAQEVNLNFLELFIYISVIAAFVQVLEIIIDRLFPPLYNALGIYLPLITVNCVIFLSLLSIVSFWKPAFSQQHVKYPFIPNLVYAFENDLGWWLTITHTASIQEKLSYSNIISNLRGMGITFIITGLIALSFMVFTGTIWTIPEKRVLSRSL